MNQYYNGLALILRTFLIYILFSKYYNETAFVVSFLCIWNIRDITTFSTLCLPTSICVHFVSIFLMKLVPKSWVFIFHLFLLLCCFYRWSLTKASAEIFDCCTFFIYTCSFLPVSSSLSIKLKHKLYLTFLDKTSAA